MKLNQFRKILISKTGDRNILQAVHYKLCFLCLTNSQYLSPTCFLALKFWFRSLDEYLCELCPQRFVIMPSSARPCMGLEKVSIFC